MDKELIDEANATYVLRYEKNERVEAAFDALNNLVSKISHFPLDPRFNSILPVLDVFTVLKEIMYCNSHAIAAHTLYTQRIEEHKISRHIAPTMNLFVSDVFYRIFSVYDKIIYSYSMYLSYKDPEATYTSYELLKELEDFIKFGKVSHPLRAGIEKCMNLRNQSYWKYVIKLRHQETHRLDPKIDVYGIRPGDDWSFNKRISEAEARELAEKSFETGYSIADKGAFSSEQRKILIEEYVNMQEFEGYYYKQIPPSCRMDAFEKAQTEISKCIESLLELGRELSEGLIKCEPFLSLGGNPWIQ